MALTVGCVPADPELPPLGIRIDDGAVAVVLPLCKQENIVAAKIYRQHEDREGDLIWSAKDAVRPEVDVVLLDAKAWSKVSGDYVAAAGLSLEIDTEKVRLGTVLDEASLRRAARLPAGEFLVNDRQMSRDQYRDDVTQDFCASNK